MRAIPHALHNRATWAAMGVLALAAVDIAAQQPTAWKTGTAIRRQLDELVDVTLQDCSLREGLDRLAHGYGVAIFLDRRIDPEQVLKFTVREAALESVLQQIAATAHAETAVIGSVVYLGPPQTGEQIATLAAIRRQEASRVPNEVKTKLLRSEAWQWEELVQPRELLRELARQVPVSVQNPEAIPHDLWAAGSWPTLAWVERMTLLLAGFGMTFEMDPAGASVRIVPAPAHVTLEKRYTPRGSAADLVAQLRRVLPEMELRVEQGQIVAVGRQEDHEKIERLLAGQSVRTVKPQKKEGGEKLYTLKVENQPAGNVVSSMATSLGKELKYDPALTEKLKQPVTFNLKGATLEQFMETTLKPLGLTYRVTEKELEIVAGQ